MVSAKIQNSAEPMLDELAKNIDMRRAKAVMQAAQIAAGILRKTIRDNVKHSRTGGLMRSFRETLISATGKDVAAGVFSDLVYARIQDGPGATRIFPRTRKYLAIPLPFANVPLGKWPRQWPNLQLIARRGKSALLAVVKKNKLEPKYILKPSVVIRGKDYINKAIGEANPIITDTIAEFVQIEANRAAAHHGHT